MIIRHRMFKKLFQFDFRPFIVSFIPEDNPRENLLAQASMCIVK